MAAEDVILITLRAVDELTSPMQGMIGSLGDFGNIMTGLKSTINLVAGALEGAWDFTSQFVDAAAASEVAVTKLNTVLESTGGTFGLTSQQLQSMALDMQNMSGFSDEAEMSAEAMLMRFENLNDIFPVALQLTNDLAVSLGMNLTTAAQTIGKALDDPASGIGRLNTQFKLFNDTEMENIKTMAEHGNVAEAQMLIIERLREKVGGAAEAYGTTFSGALDIAKEKLDNVKETIGGAMLPILGNLLDTLNKFLDNPAITYFFSGLATTFQNFPIDPLGAIVDMLYHLGYALEQIGVSGANDFLSNLGDSLLNGTTLSFLTDAFQKWAESIDWGQISNDIAAGINSIDWSFVGQQVRQAFINIFNGLAEIVTSINWMSLASAIANALGDLLAGILGYISWEQMTTNLITTLSTALGAAFEKISKTVMDSTRSVVNFGMADLQQVVYDGIVKIANSDQLKTVFQYGLTDLFSDIWNNPTVQSVIHFGLVDLWTFIVNQIKYIFSFQEVQDAFHYGLLDMLKDVQAGLSNAINWDVVKSIFNFGIFDLIDYIKSLLGISSPSTVFFDIGVSLIQGLIDGVSSMWNLVVSFFADLLNAILAPFKPILDLLGIDLNFGGSTGSVGGGTGGGGYSGGGTGTVPSTVSGNTITNNFYGPVFFGDLSQLGYDCPSPHPLVAASQGSLLVSPSIG